MRSDPSTKNRHSSPSRRGLVAQFVIFTVVAIALVGVGIFFYYPSFSGNQDSIDPILATVTRGEFVSQVLDQGEVQSSENVEIRCEVSARGGSLSVIEVCPEGTRVKAGDFLVRLDSSSFEKELEQQKIAVANSLTSVIQSKAAKEAAVASRKEYVEGIFVEKLKEIENEAFDAESQIETANQEYQQALDYLNHTKKLVSKGFATNQQLETDKFGVAKAEIAKKRGLNSKELAATKKRVLIEITREKELIQLDSDIEAANVKYNNELEAKAVEEGQLEEIQNLIAKCEIRVPKGVSGQVVYAKESSRGGNDWVLEEGTTVRERQVLVRLPNPDKMEVKALINEQSITQIEPGMPVSISVDALNDQTLKGIVTKVNQYAESSGWMSSSVRKYAVFVKILDPPEALKPGMNASVNIQVRYEKNAILAPIQTVYAVQDQQFCLVKKGEDEWETREVEVAADNSQMVLITSGLEEGEELVMNPGAYKEMMDLPEIKLDTKIELPEGGDQEAQAARENAARVKQSGMAGGPQGQDGESRDGQGRNGPGGPGGGGGFSASGMVDGMMSRYDTSGDGKIDQDEMASLSDRAKGMVENADADGDGAVTKDELTKAAAAMMQRFRGGGGGGGGE